MEPRKWHARRTAPDTAPSAAHAATDPAPAPGAAPAADSPAAAVSAALAANPGSTVAAIADAAGTGKPAARAALLEMEKDGTATRTKGDRPGIPDTWTLAGPAPDGSSPAADPEAGQAGQPGDDPAGSPDPAAGDETAGGTGHDGTAEAGDPARRRRPGDRREPEPDDAPAEAGHEDAVPDEPDELTPRPSRAATRPTTTPRTARTPRQTPATRPPMRRTPPSSRN